MVFDVSVAMTWVLFIALFPLSFFWLRRAWRIAVKRDFSEVALKRGLPPDNPQKFAPYVAAINLLAGVIVVTLIVGVLAAYFDYATWSAVAGTTIWLKLIADFILSRHAHPPKLKNKPQ
jgi:ABC-type phosphate transport system permease subunit